MFKVCTNPERHAYFGQGKKGKDRHTCPKYAQIQKNMHTSGRRGGKRPAYMSKVCTNPERHAYFGQERREKAGIHVRSVHRSRETCILRAEERGKDRHTCPKCAQIQKNMHTSGRDARRRRRRGIGKNHQKIKHTAVYSKKIHTFIGCRENYRKN